MSLLNRLASTALLQCKQKLWLTLMRSIFGIQEVYCQVQREKYDFSKYLLYNCQAFLTFINSKFVSL